MRLDVFLTPGELSPGDIVDRTVVVVDVLRATSTIVQALASGAKSIYPVASIEEALRLANTFGRDEVLLCGERRWVRIEGFDLGNSPREFTPDKVRGKILVMSTTNGTNALALTTGAGTVLVGSLLNLGAIVDELVRTEVNPVVLCSGREKHFSLEDAALAGLLSLRLVDARAGDWRLNDGARAAMTLAREFGAGEALFRTAAGGQSLVEAGFADDLAFCARMDAYDILPVLHERNITLYSSAAATT